MKNFRKAFFVELFFLILISSIFAETHVSEERQKLIDYGLTLQGTPYVWGGKRPETGLDCSGFVGYVAEKALEKKISGSAAMMYKSLEHISPEEREPGDLIFFAVKSGDTYNITHVGIYLGLYHGEGRLDGERIFLHSASDGKYTGVIVSSINDSYWEKHFYGYARFLPPTPIEEETIEAPATENDMTAEPAPEPLVAALPEDSEDTQETESQESENLSETEENAGQTSHSEEL
ncbi:MAG: C40 family peptidase [Treponema sp.]|nr:C40 family peptidase [Treponema sp.]